MAKYLAGFLLGVVASWFWFYKLSPDRNFRQALRQELVKGGSPDLVDRLDQRMEKLENRCRRLEAKLACDAVEAPGETGLNGTSKICNRREQVIKLWEEGCSPEEIIRNTGLSKGEVELILSLKDRLSYGEKN